MSRHTKAAWAELTSYEAEQVRQIAAWKSEPPNPFAELFKKVTLPGARWLDRRHPGPDRHGGDREWLRAHRPTCRTGEDQATGRRP